MYNVCYAITAVHPSMPDELLVRLNEAAVEGLAGIDAVLLSYYHLPPIYEVTPRLRYKVSAKESWKDIGAVLRDGWGDCKDFTAWRLAELRRMGIQARAESIVQRIGRTLKFHTYVRYQNGNVEDPAKFLGMP